MLEDVALRINQDTCHVAAFSGGFRKGMAGWQSAEGGIKPGTLSDVDARKWYLEQEAKIPDLIDDG